MNSTTVLPRKSTEMANSKDVVVTGVATGIGWGTTKVLVSKGFRVFGSVRKQADADRLQREFGDEFVPLLMDITDADAVHQAAQKVGSMIGDRNLVGLVNNAGIVVSGPLLYLRPSEFKRQLEVNMISPLVVIQAFAPLLGTDKTRQGPTGRVVNISSTGAKVAIPLLGAYSSSKFGLEGMSDALRRELMLFGIDLVIIEPGTVNTAMYDKGEKEDLSEFKQTEYWEACRTSRSSSSPKHVITAYPLSVWAKPSTWHSARRNRRRAMRLFRNASRTGPCPDFFPRGWLTPSSRSNSDSQRRSQARTPTLSGSLWDESTIVRGQKVYAIHPRASWRCYSGFPQGPPLLSCVTDPLPSDYARTLANRDGTAMLINKRRFFSIL